MLPTDPVPVQAVCAEGEVTEASVTLPPDGGGISYTMVPADPQPGGMATVTATLAPGYAWGDPFPTTWTITSPTTATFTVTLAEAVPCAPLVPVDPDVVEATCVDGVVTDPLVTPADEPEGIEYTVSPGEYGPGDPVTVEAELVAAGAGWPPADEMPGWTITSPTTATFTVTLAEAVPCAPLVPLDPDVVEATCVDGVVTDPLVTPADEPEGIEYTVSPGEYGPGDPVTVEAELVAAGAGWPPADEMPGWTITSPTTATFTVTLAEAVPCAPLVPLDPDVVEATCVDGVVTDPLVTPADEPEGIEYTVTPGEYGPGDPVTVEAELVAAGAGWPPADEMPGWTITSPTTATFTVTLAEAVPCAPLVPLDPDVVEATCVDGVVTDPLVTPADEPEGIEYTVSPGEYGPGDPVTVEAELVAAGAGWPPADEMPGWTITSPTTATFTVTLAEAVPCAPLVPLDPDVVEATCVDGVVTDPLVTPADEPEGIEYTVTPGEYGPGDPVTVEAELVAAGAGWPPADEMPGWTITSPTTATFTVTLAEAVPCAPLVPLDPDVVEATCVDGVVTDPLVTPADEPEGIEYTVPPGEYGPGDPVTVTATLADGYAWQAATEGPSGFAGSRRTGLAIEGAPPPVDLPEGWTYVSPTEATYTVTLAAVPDCPEPTTTTLATTTVPGGSSTTPGAGRRPCRVGRRRLPGWCDDHGAWCDDRARRSDDGAGRTRQRGGHRQCGMCTRCWSDDVDVDGAQHGRIAGDDHRRRSWGLVHPHAAAGQHQCHWLGGDRRPRGR